MTARGVEIRPSFKPKKIIIMKNSKLKVHSTSINQGFTMTFKNGWTISVQFGASNYCANRFKTDISECANAEICIWDYNGENYKFQTDEVKGWCSADEVAEWISAVSKFENINQFNI